MELILYSGVSCDGTWQRRGHSSLNGCVFVMSIGTGKVLDGETLTALCKECCYYLKDDKNSVKSFDYYSGQVDRSSLPT